MIQPDDNYIELVKWCFEDDHDTVFDTIMDAIQWLNEQSNYMHQRSNKQLIMIIKRQQIVPN